MLLRHVSFLVIQTILADSACLSDGIPEEKRMNLVNANGESYPVGVFISNYAASFAAQYLGATLIEEVLGYNTMFGDIIGSGSVAGYYGVAGCRRPNDWVDRGCMQGVTYYHVHFESWFGYPSDWEFIQKTYVSMAPQNLGTIGYNGLSTMYIPKPVQERAYSTEGLAIQYFRNWNASWHLPSKYFGLIASIDTSKLMPCSESVMADDFAMRHYVWSTGDAEGVVINNDQYSGRCDDGFWWAAPSCRADTSLCVGFITGGTGWAAEEMMQKYAIWNMPGAVGVAASWADYIQLPLSGGLSFYWWIPDPTFLELVPLPLEFPPYNVREFAQGIQTSSASAIPINTIVSWDLGILAPIVHQFADNLRLTLDQMDAMLWDQKSTGDTWEAVTCRWIQANRAAWQRWIPNESVCFPGFGLFDPILNEFSRQRVNVTNKIVCKACPPGTFSQQMTDNEGDTYVCLPCGGGKIQPSGAALSCRPCKTGEYQDEPQSTACKRCDFGAYQDEEGQLWCKICPDNTTTLGFGSIAPTDCGCPENYIDMDRSGAFECVPCSEGMTCPALSELADLESGGSNLGEAFAPKIQKGYYSIAGPSTSTKVYRCPGNHCPGGPPGTCSGGTEGPTCDRCPANMYMVSGNCTTCGAYQAVGWTVGPIVFLPGLFVAYYSAEKDYIVRASLFESGKLVMGLLLSFVQNLGILSLVTVPWPKMLKEVFEFSSIFVLNLKSSGLSCSVNTDLGQHLLVAGCFASVVTLMPCIGCITQLLPSLRNRGLSWTRYQAVSAMGKFLSTWFVTMCSIGIAPFVCFTHPNGDRSIAKYPNTLCGTAEHSTMQWVGILLLTLSLTHALLCAWALHQAPAWSLNSPERLAAIAFLLANYRPSCWWFGMVILIRGPLLSIGQVIAPDAKVVQLLMMSCVLLASFCLQTWHRPWSVPLVNLVDAISTGLFLMLLAVSLHLTPSTASQSSLVETIGLGLFNLSFGIIAVVAILCFVLVAWGYCLRRTLHLRLLNLRWLPDNERMLFTLEAVATTFAGGAANQKDSLIRTFSSELSVYDVFILEEALELLSIDCGLSSDTNFSQKRIAAKRNRSRWSRVSARPCADKEVEPVELDDPGDPKEGGESDVESSLEKAVVNL